MFKSSILMENSSTNNNPSIMSTTDNKKDTYIYNLLEFNDKLHDIDISDKISYYRALREDIYYSENTSLVSVNEGIIGNISNMLSKIIHAIIDFIKKIARKIFHKGYDSSRETCRKNNRNTQYYSIAKSWHNNPSTTHKLNIFYYPNIGTIDTQDFRACLNNITSALNRVCNNEYADVSNASLTMAYKVLVKLIRKKSPNQNPDNKYNGSIDDAKSFNEFIKTEICFKREEEMNYNDWNEYYKKMSSNSRYNDKYYASKISEFERDLLEAKKMIERSNIKTVEGSNNAKMLLNQIQAIITAWTYFINTIQNFDGANYNYHNNIYSAYVACNKSGSVSESSSIHGEEFNSDTLFDNEDMRDFNRTEWLDLELTTECYEIKYEMEETRKRIALQEALIMTDDQPNKFNRLVAMREAEEKKFGNKIKEIMARIKEFIDKFIANIKNRCNKASKRIQRNKEFIKRPVLIKTFTSTGDIIAGMYRIQQKMNIIPFNYESMKDDLKDKNTFFKNKVLPSLKSSSNFSKRKIEWNDDMSIVDYCKVYFGASMPEDKYPKCVFTGKEIQTNMDNMLTFISEASIINAVRNDYNGMNNESNKASNIHSSQLPSNTTDNNVNNTQKQDEAKQESMYYSELYGRYFTEGEIEMDQTVAQQQNAGNGSANTNNDEADAFKVYTECYKDVLLSKLTASEFILKELTQIVDAHAQSYMNSEQKKADNEQKAKDENDGTTPPTQSEPSNNDNKQ